MRNVNEMTLKEKLGQLIMAGFEDPVYDEHARVLIEEYKVGNIIYFARNVENIEQLATLTKKLYKEIMDNTGIMPFIGIDQEGGMVTRIMDGATFCPGAMTITSTGDKNNAYRIGEIMGEELAILGINFNLAPDLDVNNNPLNPVIGVRSYSDNPNVVGEFGCNYIKGLQSKGIIATAKHFPGHGDTQVDSHLGLPRISHSLEHLKNMELVPFKKAIDEGVQAIMSAHIIFEALDEVPCTLSYNVLTKMLREELGFNGIIISDCMQMKAIDTLYTTPKGCVMGIKGGLDICCVSHSLEKQVAALKALEEAINDGLIPMSLIDEKVERILKAKEVSYKHMKESFIDKDVKEIVKYFDNISNHKEFSQKIVDESITLIKGERFKKNGKTIIVGTSPYATTIAEDTLNPRSVIDNVKYYIKDVDTLTIESNPENIDEVIGKLDKYDTICFLSYNINSFKKQMELLKKVIELNKKLYVIATRNPYDYINIKEIENFTCMYEYTPASVKSLVKYLNGELEASGKLPVNL